MLTAVNKEFLVFMFFLAFSGIFWLLMTLNETYEKELTVKLELKNIPGNVVITSDPPAEMRFTVRDKGYMIAGYIYGGIIHPLTIDFQGYANGKGYGSVSISDLNKQLYQQLYKSSKIISTKPDKIEFYYNLGRKKRFPIQMSGIIKPGGSYYLSHVKFYPDSATVYGTKAMLDSIKAVHTTYQKISNFSDTMTITVPLRKIRGTKIVPDTVRMKLFPDILTEETVEVPIEAVNMPDNMTLRMFPSKVRVRFVVGANRLRNMPKNVETKTLLPTGFKVTADYNSIVKRHSDKCPIYLRSVPAGVRNARLETTEVDYLLEQL